jgi:hypothetical protein
MVMTGDADATCQQNLFFVEKSLWGSLHRYLVTIAIDIKWSGWIYLAFRVFGYC